MSDITRVVIQVVGRVRAVAGEVRCDGRVVEQDVRPCDIMLTFFLDRTYEHHDSQQQHHQHSDNYDRDLPFCTSRFHGGSKEG